MPQAPLDAPVLREDHGSVAHLRMNRPKARNALSMDLMAALRAAFETLRGDDAVCAVVLSGAPPAFCAGHDLKEMTEARGGTDAGAAFFQATFDAAASLMQAIVNCPKPVIAAVEGIATAAGCQLVASCDLAIAGRSSRFATPGVNIGLFCSTPMVALSRNVPRKAAMEMLLRGDMIEAEKALEWGLINAVAEDGEAVSRALDWAADIAAKSPLTVRIGKEAFYRQLEMPLADAYLYTADVMTRNMLAEDAEEGIDAFLTKRKAEWRGR
ncbi:MAG: enoyl-CoA hydratase [Flavobacteriaceae bacterium]